MNFSMASVKISPLGIIILIIGGITGGYYLYGGYYITAIEQRTVNLKELLSASIDLVQLAGAKVKLVRESNNLEEIVKGETKEGVKDPLTLGDILSHRILTGSLRKAFPSVKVISEEHDPADSSPAPFPNLYLEEVSSVKNVFILNPDELAVWVDPLDATKEYTDWAWVGYNSSSNLAEVPAPDPKAPPRIIVSMSHKGQVEEVAQRAFGQDVKILSAAGAGHKVLSLLKGEADVYVHSTNIKKWDVCAGNAILNHFKGDMTTFEGEKLSYVANSDPLNDKGLLATMHNHEEYRLKLRSGKEEE